MGHVGVPPLCRHRVRRGSLHGVCARAAEPAASAPNFPRYRSHLRQGWLFGRLRDDSDFQYKTFREHFPLLAVLLAVYCSLSWLSSRFGGGKAAQVPSLRSSGHSQSTAAPQRRFFLAVFTAVFVIALHGTNALKLGLVLLINYTIARSFGGTRVAPVLIWTFNIGTLAAVHWNDGFPWRDLSWQLGWLDDYPGLLPRWQINFNISMLRLVSYALDLHWARQAPPKLYEPEPEPRKRAATSLSQEKYSFGHYLLYVCYPPLFIAGPIMGFNDFVRQLDNPPRLTRASRISYAVRFAACLLTMELVLHYIYVNAIKDSKAWAGSTPMQLSMIGFWNLIIVWLKLLIPWRFFRLWALLDGVEPPENMVRCMANNYSTMGFWRSWHRSYNLWTVRYIYVPVGGSKNLIPATLLVFTFVALWHDLSLKLLTWGWLVTAFIVPELAAAALLPAKRFGTQWWYRHVCAFGGVLNVLLMMTANLVGFAIGTEGMKYMWQELLGTWNGLRFLAAACCALYCAVHIMFECRAEELRHGIARKC
ncbi:putative GUP1-Multimembrane-spanning protein essential for proton symport of glycerol [Tilletiopsis washingtonensis]|uniref:Putative GUP1-Multimembrane-spanning protein essential for proton symport of glycerol n=1 Tax=Tilletiopsis washingtonensis TaxID=58919 RepID=A0A316ZAB4_9BASI|nr:putative GUP1-Multimembrane-spanning protein essential for proton symport of glycerol [Tilletiopsis washingtonensis]PWN97902.1 putative GUP1-Multimembrane-spanning protein essential for proton symport of glycerol [Tilletiopsis washingtonensis]